MKLKKVSLPKTSSYYIEGEGYKTREEIISLSHDWTEGNITLFKKLAKQGGMCTIGGFEFRIKVRDKVLNSKGLRDEGVGVMPGPEN